MSIGGRGLGRGLDALFQNNEAGAAGGVSTGASAEPRKLGIDSLEPNPQQPRRYFADAQLEELAASIKAQGVLQPILVRPADSGEGRYEIIAGERRWRAAKRAGLASVPVVVRDMNDQEVLVVALMENLQREDLNAMEEALGLQQLKEEFGLSQEDMAARLGKSRPAIANALRLLALPDAAREDLVMGRFSAGHARALLAVTDPQCRERLRLYLAAGHCTVREAERIASIWKESGTLPEDIAAAFARKPALGKGSRQPLDQGLLAIQERLGRVLSLPVAIRGGEGKGRISLSYTSREELESLLKLLGATEGNA